MKTNPRAKLEHPIADKLAYPSCPESLFYFSYKPIMQSIALLYYDISCYCFVLSQTVKPATRDTQFVTMTDRMIKQGSP